MREVEFTGKARINGWLVVTGRDKATGIMHGRKAPDAETGRREVQDWFDSDEFQRFAAAGGFSV